jgi:hypothetical protein
MNRSSLQPRRLAPQRPSGPTNCLRSRAVSVPCAVCGATPEIVHMPINGRGFFCVEHCPNCNGGKLALDPICSLGGASCAD